METDVPRAWEPPLAAIREIRFGLMTSADIVKLSVYPATLPVTNSKQLADPQLGLPTAKGVCTTCTANAIDDCQGHFSHCQLPLPIFHPNHVGKLVTILRKVCLNCGQPKKKRAGRFSSLLEDLLNNPQQFAQDATQPTPMPTPTPTPMPTPMAVSTDDDDSDAADETNFPKNKRKYSEVFMDVEAGVDKPREPANLIILSSSDDEDMVSSAANHSRRRSEDDETERASSSADQAQPTHYWNLRKRKRPAESTGNSATRPSSKGRANVVLNGDGRHKLNRGKATPTIKEEDEFLDIPLPSFAQAVAGPCKYCSGHSERYPDVVLKVVVREKETGKDENMSKAIQMEYKLKKDAGPVASDFWKFVECSGRHQNRGSSVKKSRQLLPSEALTILSKIHKSSYARLGMHSEVAQPEALILECLPVPPNCSRMQDDFDSVNVGYKQGGDRATQIFSTLVNRINAINKRNNGKPDFDEAALEASELQSLFGLYLREKGAPKPVPGKERRRVDHVGREQKAGSRWTLEWLKRHMLGKRGGHSGRNVLTGDPFLNVDEIGIPWLFAKNLTIPERVNNLNKDKLQECVELGKELTGRYRACGAVRIWTTDGERVEVMKKTTHDLKLGDVVDRHLRDGDLVYVNRPPSLHKHSLLALKVRVQDMPVFTINPAACAPLHADFDGDCLHFFVPQSEEAKAELVQLMSIPEQILPLPDGKAIIGMSQDNILATHLLTSTPVFLSKVEMCQISMWATRRLPIPAIVKAGNRGPLWTGNQLIDMTLPRNFEFSTKNSAISIKEGELISYGGKEKWLASTNGLICALARTNPHAAVEHLNCSQSVLREWLLSRGFSASLQDFYVAASPKARKKMVDELKASLVDSVTMATCMELIFSRDYQTLDEIHPCTETATEHSASQTGDMAVGYFQQQFDEIGEDLARHIGDENQLMAMFRSGSKGSLSKVMQQVGCLGLQLYKGQHLLPLSGNAKLERVSQATSCEEALWEAQGLVKSSLLDGLNPLEFYLHAIAVRAGLLRQSLEVTSPGELFKNLMLFLRDIHISYDETVRSNFGQEIIQFSYGGGESTPSRLDSSGQKVEFFMAGEAVGILAATAIAQPAYQVMLEANHNVGSKKIRPLALLQETLFPRKDTKMKAADRRIILRLKPCRLKHSDERRILRLRNELQPVSLGMIAKALSIQYISADSVEWNECHEHGKKLSLPWIGHVQLNKNAMIQSNMEMQGIVDALETAFIRKKYKKVLEGGHLMKPVFFYRDSCDCRRAADRSEEIGPCLHFSASLMSQNSKRMASRSDKKLLDFVKALRDVMVPLIFKTIIKGDERVESTKIVWEAAAWSPRRDDVEQMPIDSTGELVVEVVVQKRISSRRGTPWIIMTEACAHLEDIDWKRSTPYSVQEVQHSLGVEAACDCIFERLALSAQSAGPGSIGKTHLKLVADLMVHSGEVNGMTSSGYRDRLRSLKTSAPFTAGAFRAPIKTFMEAGEKGDKEFLNGVLASSIFGKRVPLGTGADFTVQLHPKLLSDGLEPLQSANIFDQLATVNGKIKVQFPDSSGGEPESNVYSGTDQKTDWGTADGGTWSMDADAGGWASGAVDAGGDQEDGGPAAPVFTSDAGLWDSEDASAYQGGSADASKPDESDWGQVATANGTEGGTAGVPVFTPDAGLWDSGDVGVIHEVGKSEWGKNLDTIEVEGTGAGVNEGGSWSAPSPSAGGDDGNWETELPLPTGPKRNTFSEAAIENEPASGEFSTGWGSGAVVHDVPERDGRWGSEPGADSPRKDRKERDRRTGANLIEIPPEKMRKFAKSLYIEELSIPGTSVSESETSHLPEKGTARQEPQSEWTTTPVQEEESEGLWEQGLDSQSFRETPSDWDSGSAPFRSHAGHTGTPGSERNGQTGGNASGGGLSTPRAQNARRIDSRKDSPEWHDLIEIVRTVRDILQQYKAEEKLTDEHSHIIRTQVLPHHPNNIAKVGCGVESIKVATSKVIVPNERASTCFFVVRSDGSEDDFSYHKCLKNLAAKKDPPLDDLYQTAFGRRPLRHQA